jgi:hypothetical protein
VALTVRFNIAPVQQEVFTWSFPGGPLRINLPLGLIARLQAEIDKRLRQHADTSQVEIGGVLLGREGALPDTVEIEDYVYVPSGTADGRFDWSSTAFKQIISPSDQTRSVGYFRTEWGDTLTLRDEELDGVQKHLSDRTKVVLLIQNSPEARKAGFLFWDGDEFTPISFMDFPFDAEVLKQETSQRSVSHREARREEAEVSEEAEIAPAPTQETTLQKTERGPARLSTKGLWMPCTAMFGLGAGVALLCSYYLQPSLRSSAESQSATDALHLDVTTQANGIHAQWNQGRAVRDGAVTARVHRASIRTTAASWISACADGQALAGKILPAGSEVEIEFFRQAQLVVGNAGGVQMALEGKPLGPLGPEAKARLVELTPSRFRVLASGTLDRCGKQ